MAERIRDTAYILDKLKNALADSEAIYKLGAIDERKRQQGACSSSVLSFLFGSEAIALSRSEENGDKSYFDRRIVTLAQEQEARFLEVRSGEMFTYQMTGPGVIGAILMSETGRRHEIHVSAIIPSDFHDDKGKPLRYYELDTNGHTILRQLRPDEILDSYTAAAHTVIIRRKTEEEKLEAHPLFEEEPNIGSRLETEYDSRDAFLQPFLREQLRFQ